MPFLNTTYMAHCIINVKKKICVSAIAFEFVLFSSRRTLLDGQPNTEEYLFAEN